MRVPLLPKTKKKIKLRPVYFIATPTVPTDWLEFVVLLHIKSAGEIVPFVPYDYQVEIIRAIEAAQNVTICKSRQMGISELICSYLLMRALTEPGFSAVVFSKTQADSSALGVRISEMAKSLSFLCPEFENDSKTHLKWVGFGQIYFLPVTARAARSIPSVSVIFYDEMAFIEGIEAVYSAAAPTLSMLGDKAKIINNSTPNGKQGLYWELLSSDGKEGDRVIAEIERIRKPENPTVAIWGSAKDTKILLHYHGHPIYGKDPEWPEKERQNKKLRMPQWRQEYELDFLESGALVFDSESVEKCANGIYLPPIPGHDYLAGTDPSFGGGDSFVTQVWDITVQPFALVARYSANHRSNDANLLGTIDLYRRYQPTVAGVETNGGGALVLQELIKVCPWVKLIGVHTTGVSKIINTDRLGLLMERSMLLFPPDSDYHYQCKHFVERASGSSRKREAEQGYQDDEIMAAAVAFACLGEAQEGNWIYALI
jgi:hypothetical protein